MRTLLVAGALLVITWIAVGQTLYTVDETQQVIVTRLGEYKRTVSTPGLKVKTPFVENVLYLDERVLRFDAPRDEITTADKKRLVVDAYARWKIVDPRRFYETVRDNTQARARLSVVIGAALRAELARDTLEDIIALRREAITAKVAEEANREAAPFGIKIIDVRIKRTDFPGEVSGSIYARMQAERERIAKGLRAEGTEEELKIKALTDKERAIILAEAQRQSQVIRGGGEAQAIEIYARALEQDPEFYAFQRSLDAYREFLKENTTVVFSSEDDLFRFLTSPGLAPTQ